MDIVDLGMKLGLSGTTLLFFVLFIREQMRHDETRNKYAEFEKTRADRIEKSERERQDKDRDLAKERVAVDRESTVAFTKLGTLIAILMERSK